MTLSVVIPTHNPRREFLQRTLDALRRQTIPCDQWECLVIDNASSPPLELGAWAHVAPTRCRIVREETLGLSAARRGGLRAAGGELVVLVDDDNVLAPDYLAQVASIFASHPRLGAAGGKCLPEFESAPPLWAREFFPLLALRDHGPQPVLATSLMRPGATGPAYPAAAAPIGAGMALRRATAATWAETSGGGTLSDRRGVELTSGGDNDIVFAALEGGWSVGYFPELVLTHLIPAARLDPAYLARLNRGIQKSWMQVLTKHGANPWPPIAGWTVPLRQAKAWFAHCAWRSEAARIRWHGACGHFEGRRPLAG